VSARARLGAAAGARVGAAVTTLALAIGAPADAQTAAPAAGPAPAYAGEPATHARAIAEARRLVRDTMRVLGAPGASVTVMRAGRVVWSEGFGWADLEQQVPVTPLTRFRIGSVSKPLTTAALGLLVEQGKVDLDAPVQRYVPGFPAKRWPITVRQVAGHLGGIRHYRGEEMLNQRPYATVASGLAIFRDDSLVVEPGTRYLYSSYGYNLLSAVIEGAAGEPFLRLMRERVFAPAGLRQTVAEHPDSLIPFRARFYTRRDSASGIVNAPYVDNSYKWAGGGFLSTTEDLARFGQAMLDGTLLRPATTQTLWTSQRTRDGKETKYGIGWSVDRDRAGRRRVAHSGGSVGGTAYLLLYPEQQLVVAVLVNSDRTFVGATPRIAEAFLR
jgi:CubicO group peptidase (beta-lactamase class C family)